ncbi:MAG: HNH endonuclease [Planctomycetaceae bacterium]|nr:HNH endonuclease [Planctomycetaceae bacterium]
MRKYKPLQSKKQFKRPIRRNPDAPKDRHTVPAHKRGYDSKWRRARDGFLRRHPLCRRCEAEGRVTPANCVDHIIPWTSVPTYEEQRKLFWDSSNWQSLCDHRSPHNCHAKKTAEDQAKYDTYPAMTKG